MAFGRFLLWGERIALVPLGGRIGIGQHGEWMKAQGTSRT